MTDMDDTLTLPPALERAFDLLADPPVVPDIGNGYLDLLDPGVPTGGPRAETIFTSRVGSMVYDTVQAQLRKLITALQQPNEWLNIPSSGIALDVGCGPGNITASLARAAGPGALALGLDISEAMLRRAASAEAGPQVGFLRADAQQLPLRDATVDAVVSISVLQLVPDPTAALSEMVRVLRPGGRLAVMVPTAGWLVRPWRVLPNLGVHLFGVDEIGDILEDRGMAGVRTQTFGTLQWVRATRGPVG
jgi:SAM-dependent methyltransferase